jgi:lipoate-protein ligase A
VHLDTSVEPDRALSVDNILLADVREGRSANALRVWECAEGVVLPARRLRLLGENPAGAHLCARRSGGGAVGIGPGVVCVSVVVPLSDSAPNIDAAYGLWMSGVSAALSGAYGLTLGHGEVPGAFCDGEFNGVIGGRKVAGTAQVRRSNGVLIHGCILVDVDPVAYCRRLARFYPKGIDPSLITTLSVEAGSEISRDGLAMALAVGFASVGVGVGQSVLQRPIEGFEGVSGLEHERSLSGSRYL